MTNISSTILQQLGGNKFLAMTGAKHLSTDGRNLGFQFPRNAPKNKAKAVRITLDDIDTYTVEFFRVRGFECSEISKHEMVFADRLAELVANETGLMVRL